MQASYMVLENFFESANELRRCFELHFADPHKNRGPSHQIWDYWYVPELYTYLRTDPKLILPAGLIDLLFLKLRAWASTTLGMNDVSPLYLSLYVNGCCQGLHNDSGNGRWGFVYSLTSWHDRKFSGGETLLWTDSPYWQSEQFKHPGAGNLFYELVPPRFNQLLVFDDRLIHAVRPIEGNMNPIAGRVVLHGHIREGAIEVKGALAQSNVSSFLSDMAAFIRSQIEQLAEGHHGCLSFKMAISPAGGVETIHTLSDRILAPSAHARSPSDLARQIERFIRTVRFPASNGPTSVILPIAIG